MAKKPCQVCGGDHDLVGCIRTKAVEFYRTGEIRRVEFFSEEEMQAFYDAADIDQTPEVKKH